MITDFILEVMFGLATALVDFLPEWVAPSTLTTSASTLGVQFSQMNSYAPVSLLGACLLLILGVKVFLSLWRLAVFIYDRFPFKAS